MAVTIDRGRVHPTEAMDSGSLRFGQGLGQQHQLIPCRGTSHHPHLPSGPLLYPATGDYQHTKLWCTISTDGTWDMRQGAEMGPSEPLGNSRHPEMPSNRGRRRSGKKM